MQSSDPCIYAAGDAASCQWAAEDSRHWFQMRLWSQARSMGVCAAHCMAGVEHQASAACRLPLAATCLRSAGARVSVLASPLHLC
jgi:hypothetical protein